MGVDTSQSWVMLLRTAVSLGAVIALIFALSWVAKKYLRSDRWLGLGGGVASIKILQSFPLEPRKKLLVVEIENQRVLLGSAENSISFLCNLKSPTTKMESPNFKKSTDFEDHNTKAPSGEDTTVNKSKGEAAASEQGWENQI